MAQERLQKILARAGVTSRRKAESLISAGRVRVDGKVISELGSKTDPKKSTIELDGRKLEPETLCYGVLHKPRGMLTTLSDPEGRPTAQDILRKVGVRVVPVGRLDFNTSGALLFTNDGDFSQALSHAKGHAPKVYAAKVQKVVDESVLVKWAESIEIEGKRTKPAAVRILRREGDKTWLEVTIHEGRNHQVRRLGDHAGTPVVRLARLSHAGITAEGLRPSDFRLLTQDELKTLRAAYGVPKKLRAAMTELPGPRRANSSTSSRREPRPLTKSAPVQKQRSEKSTRARTEAGPRGKATAGPRTRSEASPRGKAAAGPRARTEASPRGKAAASPRARAEASPRARGSSPRRRTR